MMTSFRRFAHVALATAIVGLVLLAGVLLLSGRDGRAPGDDGPAVPRLDPRLAELLAAGDDPDLVAHCRARGEATVRRGVAAVHAAILRSSPADRARLLPWLVRLGTIHDSEYGVGGGLLEAQVLARLDHAVLDSARHMLEERGRFMSDPAVGDAGRVRRLEPMVAFTGRHGLDMELAVLESSLAACYAALGEPDSQRDHLRRALVASRRGDVAMMTCQLLGELSQVFFETGQRDSAEHYLDLMERRARRSRIAVHATRAQMFRASYALADGRVGAAHLHLREARRQCVELQGGRDELRAIGGLARFYAELGCWRIVDRLTAQGELLASDIGLADDEHALLMLRLLEAESHDASGRLERALELTASVVDRLARRPHRTAYLTAMRLQAVLLLRDGQAARALAVVENGLHLARRDHVVRMERSLLLRSAVALSRLGRLTAACDRLAEARALPVVSDLLPRGDAAAEARLDLALARAQHGDGSELAAAVARAIARIERTMTACTGSAHDYLNLQEMDPLRWDAHDLVADDAAAGVLLDLAWRGLAAADRELLARARAAAADATTAREWLERWSTVLNGGPFAAHQRRLARTGATHLLYVVRPAGVVRWRVDAAGCTRDDLDVAPHELRTRVSAIAGRLSRPPRRGVAGPAATDPPVDLATLAADLLPADLRATLVAPRAKGPRLLLTLDDALQRLPLAALDLDPGPGHAPLGAHAAICHLRYCRAPTWSDAGGTALVVADPQTSPVLRRAVPGLDALPGARRQARRLLARWPGAWFLTADAATRENLMSHWERAERIAFAGHVVRDAEAPYLSYLPLAGATDGRIEDAMLEVSDVLGADLSRCRVALLAGCASGAPYVEGGTVAPGLGEAFLDAGCGTVVQTLWGMDDAAAERFGAAFADHVVSWDDPWSLAEALRAARAAASRSAGSHPFHWAPYRIVTTLP